MALIKCPECGKEVSDKAEKCVGCGYDIHKHICDSANVDSENNQIMADPDVSVDAIPEKPRLAYKLIGGAILLLIGIWFIGFTGKFSWVRLMLIGFVWWAFYIEMYKSYIKKDNLYQNYVTQHPDVTVALKPLNKTGVIVGILSILLLTIGVASSLSGSGLISGSNSDQKAWVCTQNIVRENLKSPNTAKFCNISEAIIDGDEENNYVVWGYADVENGFGAAIRQQFKVQFKLAKSGYTNSYCYFY